MSRSTDTRLHDRASRQRLKPRAQPYWRLLAEGFHIGYYKGARKASWIARLAHDTKAKSYLTATLGEADDILPADGADILDWKAALDAALRWKALRTSGAADLDPDIDVKRVVLAYIARRDTRRVAQAGRDVRSDASYKLTRHVIADRKLAGTPLAKLSEADLIAWQDRLKSLAPATRQRIVNDLKAALNMAFAEHRKVLPRDLPTTIRFGLSDVAGEVVAARARDNQILTDEQVRGVVAAAIALDADFGRLILVLAATGARFAQARRMTVADVQAAQSRVMIPQSFKGKKKEIGYIRVAVGADVLAALAPIAQGRHASAPLLERSRLRQVTVRRWEEYERGPWHTASEMTRLWKKAAAAAGLPASTIPYALRHSSIVRGLRAGLPIRLVAALHDTSVAMIERHYSRWITEGLEDMVARSVVPMLPVAA